MKDYFLLEDQPDYKLIHRGIGACTDRELLQILLRIDEDTAMGLLNKFGGITQIARTRVEELQKVEGIGRVKALQIVTAFEIGRRKSWREVSEYQMTQSDTVADYLIPRLADEEQEIFYCLFLNRNNVIVAEKEIFRGGVSATIIDPKVIFKHAVNHLASSIIIAHNHPSGSLTPSRADIDITMKIKESGKLLDIVLLDHLIVSSKGFYSFADNGMI